MDLNVQKGIKETEKEICNLDRLKDPILAEKGERDHEPKIADSL